MESLNKHSGSDSEEDADYIPPPGERQSDSEGSDAERKVKKARIETKVEEKSAEQKQKERNELWKTFQGSTSSQKLEVGHSVNMVKVVVTHRFAGDIVTETKEVPEHSEDARKWPRIDSVTPTDPSGRVPERNASSTIPIDSATPTLPQSSPLPSPEFIPSSQVSTPAKRVARKPRQSLASLAAASVAKPQKLTTLQKSRLDWESHLASTSQSEVDELERNRKGGGYLEKVDFLQRVDGRKDEAMTSGKRRR